MLLNPALNQGKCVPLRYTKAALHVTLNRPSLDCDSDSDSEVDESNDSECSDFDE